MTASVYATPYHPGLIRAIIDDINGQADKLQALLRAGLPRRCGHGPLQNLPPLRRAQDDGIVVLQEGT